MALTFRLVLLLLKLWTVLSSQNATDVSLRFNGQELTNDTSRVCLTHIGEQPSLTPPASPDTAEGPALVCATTNPSCCRGEDGSPGGVGDWRLNGVVAEGTHTTPRPLIYRNRGTGLVRLNVKIGAVVTGQFCCRIPDNANVTRTLCVDVTLDEAVCSQTYTVSTTHTGRTATLLPTTVTASNAVVNVNGSNTTTTVATLPPSTAATSADSTASFALAGVVVMCVTIILLLLCLVAILYYKLTMSSRASSVVTDTALPLTDNQAYGKAEQQASVSEGSPQVEQNTELLYECISDTPPSVHSSSSSEHYYY